MHNNNKRTLPLLAVFLGLLYTLSFAPFGAWPLQWISLAGLYSIVAYGGAGALAGFAFGLAAFISGAYWMHGALDGYTQLPAGTALPFSMVFFAYCSLYPAVVCALTRLTAARRSAPVAAAVFCAAWLAGELLRSVMLGGFPWLAAGYAHVDGPLRGYAPLLGVYGMSMLSVAVSCAAAVAWIEGGNRPRLAVAVAGGLLLLGGESLSRIAWTHERGEPISVRLIQANIPQDERFLRTRQGEILAIYRDLIAYGSADLIATSETALPAFFHELDADDLRRAGPDRTVVLLGLSFAEGADRVFNSLIALREDGESFYRYDKAHLMPMGEYAPVGFEWFVKLMGLPLGQVAAGRTAGDLLRVGEQQVAPMICYEDAFGEEIAERAESASLLLNASNMAYFAGSTALPQHLQISRMRALEFGRPMLKVSNTGITAMIGADGTIRKALPSDVRGVLEGRVQGYAGATPYMRLGDWPVRAMTAAILFLAVVRRRPS